MFTRYKVELTLIRDMLGTNPCDPNVLDTHILDRQRKLILEKGGVNTQINKYLDAIPIAKEQGEIELKNLLDKLETLIGYKLTEEEREKAIRGELESLRETLQELDLKGTTVFFWDQQRNLPCIGGHMILGYLKAAGEAISRTLPKKNATILQSASYTSSVINQHVRVQEKFITFDRDIKRNEKGEAQYLQRSLRAMTAQGPRVSLAKSEIVEEGAKLSFTLKVLENSPIRQEHFQKLFQYGELSGLGQWRNSGCGQFTFELSLLP